MTTLAPVELIRQGPVASVSDPAPEQAFAWTVWPAKERPARTAALLAGITAFGVLSSVALQDVALGCVAALMLALSVQRYLLPTDHVLNSDGITVHEPLRVRRVAWRDVEGVIWKREQGFLRVSRDTSGRALARTDGMRGFIILLGIDPVAAEARRRAVDAFIRRHG